MTETDRFETAIPLHQLEVLLKLGLEFGFDPVSSTELEAYFLHLLREFRGEPEELAEWLRPKLSTMFRSLVEGPDWIQNPNWQASVNGPMLFVGQIDCSVDTGLFHDDASFYVFFDQQTGERRTVLQVA